jgi:hypothetical protein
MSGTRAVTDSNVLALASAGGRARDPDGQARAHAAGGGNVSRFRDVLSNLSGTSDKHATAPVDAKREDAASDRLVRLQNRHSWHEQWPRADSVDGLQSSEDDGDTVDDDALVMPDMQPDEPALEAEVSGGMERTIASIGFTGFDPRPFLPLQNRIVSPERPSSSAQATAGPTTLLASRPEATGHPRDDAHGPPFDPQPTAGADGNEPTELEVRLSVVRQETHFAPVSRSHAPDVLPEVQDPAEALRAAREKSDAEEISDTPGSRLHGSRLTKPDGGGSERAVAAGPAGRGRAEAEGQQTANQNDGWRSEATASPVRQDGQAPVAATASVVRQVSEGLIAELAIAEESPPMQHHLDAQSAKHASGPVLKVLEIQLEPANLGTVGVRMSLRGSALHLHLETGRHETAQLIQRDGDSLADRLQAAGYSIDAIVVQVRDGDRAGAGPLTTNSTPSFAQSSAQGQPGGSQSDRRSAGADQGHSSSFDQAKPAELRAEERDANSSGSGLYV